jgi:hypothetical protein
MIRLGGMLFVVAKRQLLFLLLANDVTLSMKSEMQ